MEAYFAETGSAFNITFISGPRFNPKNMQAAVNLCMKRHPKMSMTIDKKSGSGLVWIPIKDAKIDVESFESSSDEESGWKPIIIEINNRPIDFERDSSLFRVYTISTPTKNILVAGCHHASGDGKTGMVLTFDILNYYA